MSWVLYLFGSGQVTFLAAALVLAAVVLLPRVAGWPAAALAMLARLGLLLAILSAAPLSYWLYGLAIGVTGVWLWRERRGRESLPGTGLQDKQNQPPAKTPDPLWLRRATAAVWFGIVVLELPHQFAPRLAPLGNPPLYVIGDSLTAGMGGSDDQTWTGHLPEQIEVHNLARPGATTAMALKSQAGQLPRAGGLVLIEIGGNDLLGNTPSAQFEGDLDRLLAAVKAEDRTIVMFELPLPPLSNEYGRIQRRLASRHGVWLIPKRVLMGVLAGGGATLDSIHLTQAGHEQMAAEVWSILEPAYREQ
jgi:acyl-CoA thioesterase-1